VKIARIIEDSQAARSDIVHGTLKTVVEPLGHSVHHYGMYTPEDKASSTCVMNGLRAGMLVNSKAADFVVTGCGTGMGSTLARHTMPGAFCGLVVDPTDAFLLGQINDGNRRAMPHAKGFGWAADLSLQDCQRKLFAKCSAAWATRGSARPSWRATAAS
jgi:ribose 5-phosphate isomerase RpiB